MKQRRYFDINCTVGRASCPAPDFPHDPASLLDDMAYFRIHGAAILYTPALDYAFTAGNRALCGLLTDNHRFTGVAALPSTALFETGDPDYYGKLYDGGIRAFFAAPRTFGCTLNPRDMEKQAEFMITRHIPLLVSESQTALTELEPLLDAYPGLSVIVLNTSWGSNRRLFPLLERHPNLYFEISSNQANSILEVTKKYFGIERVLYGSAWPLKSMGALKALVEYADISESDKDMVSHGNACRLLGINSEKFTLYDDSDCCMDAIAAECDAGIPISVPVIDCHTHMAPAEDKTVSGLYMPDSGCDDIVKKLDRLGVDTIFTAPWEGICTDGMAGNEQSLYVARKYPGRFKGYNTCNINYPEDLAGWQTYLESYPEVFVGIKPYWPYQRFAIDDPVCEPWYKYANAHHLLLLLHTGDAGVVAKAGELSLRWPEITFILAHTGIDYNVARTNTSLAKQRKNVYLEITYTSCTRGMIEYLVNEAGADKVLYGTDLPMRDPAPQLGWVCYARISIEDKKKILHENISKLTARRI